MNHNGRTFQHIHHLLLMNNNQMHRCQAHHSLHLHRDYSFLPQRFHRPVNRLEVLFPDVLL
jgi:hypothetical protein